MNFLCQFYDVIIARYTDNLWREHDVIITRYMDNLCWFHDVIIAGYMNDLCHFHDVIVTRYMDNLYWFHDVIITGHMSDLCHFHDVIITGTIRPALMVSPFVCVTIRPALMVSPFVCVTIRPALMVSPFVCVTIRPALMVSPFVCVTIRAALMVSTELRRHHPFLGSSSQSSGMGGIGERGLGGQRGMVSDAVAASCVLGVRDVLGALQGLIEAINRRGDHIRGAPGPSTQVSSLVVLNLPTSLKNGQKALKLMFEP